MSDIRYVHEKSDIFPCNSKINFMEFNLVKKLIEMPPSEKWNLRGKLGLGILDILKHIISSLI